MPDSSKTSGLFVRITDDSHKSIEQIIEKSPTIADLKSRGYSIDKSVIARFGLAYVCNNLSVMGNNPEMLLAASKAESTHGYLVVAQKRECKK